MNKSELNIGIIETSSIIYEGISNVLHKSDIKINLIRLNDFDNFYDDSFLKYEIDILILNPTLIQNRVKKFKKIKKLFPNIYWIAIVYNLFSDDILFLFDDVISINNSSKDIYTKLSKAFEYKSEELQEQLSDREIEVLIKLANGLSNKEIAEKLNISTHTVITHRKNISLKTGIKSQSGLTIYAITKNIISLDKLV